MSETQKGTLHCPECGAPISAVLQQLTGWGLLTPGDLTILGDGSRLSLDDVTFDYAGETDVNWYSQIEHYEGLVKCENEHVVKLADCTFSPSNPEPFPYVEATATLTFTWNPDLYLSFCRTTNEIPTADGFISWVRFHMEGKGYTLNDYDHSILLKRCSDS